MNIVESKDDSFLQEMVKQIRVVAPEAVEIWFHGSRANGTAKKKSDWDFLVVLPQDTTVERRVDLATTTSPLRQIRWPGRSLDIQPWVGGTKSPGDVYYWAREEGKLLFTSSAA